MIADAIWMEKKIKQARIIPVLAAVATEVAAEELISFNQFINRAVKNELARIGRWPPPPASKPKK